MSYLFIVLSLLFITQTKDPKPRELSVTVTGQVELPADQINFNINVNAEGKTPQAAYNLQKKREKNLVQLLDKYGIKEKNIHYQPISINKKRTHRTSDTYDTTYATRQSVRVTLSNFDVFEKMQVHLIEHHFDDFNAHFTSSKMDKGRDKALKAALKKAKEKAQLIAQTAGLKLGSIQQIRFGATRSPSPAHAFKVQLSANRSDSMLKYDQTVTVSATVSLRYRISGNK